MFNPGLNPDRRAPWAAPLPVQEGVVTLFEATSVFTHLVEGQAEFYLDELARVLAPDGIFIGTFFLFDKADFPFMQDFQNALYINDRDPTNAVAYDRDWLRDGLRERGLAIVGVKPPEVYGFHTVLQICPIADGRRAVELPADTAPRDRRPPPLLRANAAQIGLEGDVGEVPTGRPRAEVPVPDPVAVELENAKHYIASLEEHMAALERQLAEALRDPGAGLPPV